MLQSIKYFSMKIPISIRSVECIRSDNGRTKTFVLYRRGQAGGQKSFKTNNFTLIWKFTFLDFSPLWQKNPFLLHPTTFGKSMYQCNRTLFPNGI